MVHFSGSLVVLALAAVSSVTALPLEKRIAQVIVESMAKWEQACLAAGGGQQCNPVSVASFGTLLAAAGPCAQQDAADKQIDLAKTLNNDPTMIKLSQIFAQQPRNSPSSLSVPYCQSAPKHQELNGLFQCQFKGVNLTVFVGDVPVGQPGTIPFGHTEPISPPGSCPANPSGPIADGTQLVALTQNPGVPSTGSGSGSGSGSGNGDSDGAGASGAIDEPPAPPTTTKAPKNNSPPESSSSIAAPSAPTQPSPPVGGGAADFRLQNGLDAQKLNTQFATLTETSPCSNGQDACVGGGFAQCVGNSFVVMKCAPTTTCVALPLVNKPGTSIACTTPQDAASRIAATGATGGITGAA